MVAVKFAVDSANPTIVDFKIGVGGSFQALGEV